MTKPAERSREMSSRLFGKRIDCQHYRSLSSEPSDDALLSQVDNAGDAAVRADFYLQALIRKRIDAVRDFAGGWLDIAARDARHAAALEIFHENKPARIGLLEYGISRKDRFPNIDNLLPR